MIIGHRIQQVCPAVTVAAAGRLTADTFRKMHHISPFDPLNTHIHTHTPCAPYIYMYIYTHTQRQGHTSRAVSMDESKRYQQARLYRGRAPSKPTDCTATIPFDKSYAKLYCGVFDKSPFFFFFFISTPLYPLWYPTAASRFNSLVLVHLHVPSRPLLLCTGTEQIKVIGESHLARLRLLHRHSKPADDNPIMM